MTEISIPVTTEQWLHILHLMQQNNWTQEKAVEYLLTIGLREIEFREENA